jgi:GT2 family glycosyltransferase
MQLSVIIINYNVKYFLEQCLCSVQKAFAGIQAEVLVVDNASTDGSKEYLENKFPSVSFIWGIENLGFAKANNLALKQAKGTYVLFLNPDTIVAEDSFTNCISFFEQTPNAGALGVRMIDGSGIFLPESKRAFPSSAASFYKLSGLSLLFPHSKIFARYNLGHLNEDQLHEVEVLSGAFMMVRNELLQQTGGFDETFFMYAEDIDLSYRITKTKHASGFYKNYYFNGTTIIHFKGESTQRESVKYTKLFYKAMLQFINKHPEEFSNGFLNIIIKAAILIRGTISGVKHLFLTDKKETIPSAFFVTDDVVAPKLQSIFQQESIKPIDQKTLIEHESSSFTAIVMCEGDTLSFKQIIEKLPALGNKHLVCIHASGSSSIAGSNSKNTKGFAVELN